MKAILGILGFMMLFAVPTEEAMAENFGRAMGVWALCVLGAVAALYFAGAFKPSKTQRS